MAEHLIEVNYHERELTEKKKELSVLEAAQKKEPVSQELIQILQSFAEVDDFFRAIEHPQEVPKSKPSQLTLKKSITKLTDYREPRVPSERFDSSSDENREPPPDNQEDLFMIDQPMNWQRSTDVNAKRLYGLFD